MPPESDPHFKAGFAALHRQRCAEAPAFEPMRLRAERAAHARPKEPRAGWRIPIAATAVCVAFCGLWSLREWESSRTASTQRVEQLLASIEEQIELTADFTPPKFPTDTLLTQIDTDPLL